jgi:hypothetical protein
VPTLHITNGDSAGDTLRRIVDGAVTITADPLHEGPAPPVEGDAWYDVRARFLASYGDTAPEEIGDRLASWDRSMVNGCLAGDIILWFEHDLFDQLALIRTLDLLARLKPRPTYQARLEPRPTYQARLRPRPVSEGVSLICIDRFPGVERFIGLGQLSPDQFASLLGTERPVTSEQYALASDAWEAFRSPDPSNVLAIAAKADTRALPFLGDALLRFLAEFPSVANGLSRTEELLLRTLGDGPLNGGALFEATQAQEPRPFMGDTIFFAVAHRLASARVPLLSVAAAPGRRDFAADAVSITDAGRRVLAGERDHVALNGIDLWRGGVQLAGLDRSPWRWDARRETLVS